MLARFKHLSKSDLPLHRAIISDIALWVVLALLLALGTYWFAIRLPERHGQSILLKFRDANQITKGSTVTMLGTDVGYVKNIRIHQDHIDVLVQTYSKSLPIPSGATFTVLFNGLAGSKSIDIEVPKTPMPQVGGRPVYTVAEPIRLKTLLDYMVDMTQALTMGAENITDFFGKKKPIEELQFNIQEAHQWSLDTLAYSNVLERDMRQFQHDAHHESTQAIHTLSTFNRKAILYGQRSNPEKVRPMVVSALQTLRQIRHAFIPEAPGKPTLHTHLLHWQQTASQMSNWSHQASLKVQDFPLSQVLDRIEIGEDRFIAFLDQMQAFFEQNNGQPLQQLRQNIQAFNRQVLALSLKLDVLQPSAAQQQSGAVPTPGCAPTSSTCPPPRIPMKPPRPPASGAVQTFPIVDRGGHEQKHANTWWDHHPAAQKEITSKGYHAEPSYVQPKKQINPKEPAFIASIQQNFSTFFETVWETITALFTG